MATVTYSEKMVETTIVTKKEDFTKEEWSQSLADLEDEMVKRNEIILYYPENPVTVQQFDVWNCDFTDLQAYDICEYDWYDISDDARQFLQNEFLKEDKILFVGLHNVAIDECGCILQADLDCVVTHNGHQLVVLKNEPLRQLAKRG